MDQSKLWDFGKVDNWRCTVLLPGTELVLGKADDGCNQKAPLPISSYPHHHLLGQLQRGQAVPFR